MTPPMDAANQRVLEKTTIRSEQELVEEWLGRLDTALEGASRASVASLFAADAHWRDLLAFSWSITPSQGAEKIAGLMVAQQETTRARGFAIAPGRTPPRRVHRAGNDVIEGIFRFETQVGRGVGVVRLLAAEPSKAFQLMTSLHELKGHEEKIGKHRPKGSPISRNFGGANWKEERIASLAYADRDPVVLVAGGGQAGLSIAAVLGRMGVDTLVVDRHERVGDNWRKRYRSLALHNPAEMNQLPYLPYPPSWPMYLPKDMVADWFESYAWLMELNFWTGTELKSADYDASAGRWEAVVRRTDGSERTVRPRHLVFANGLLGFPRVPELPGLKDFAGEAMHSSEFTDGAAWRGKKALVLGTGTSAHDVAQDLHANGCETTIIQRGPTYVVSIEPGAKQIYTVYEGIPIEDGDLLVSTNTLPIVRKNLQLTTARAAEMDRKMIEGLTARGFKWSMGDDNGGHQMLIRRRYGGYYLNAGCAQLIIDGAVGLMQFDEIERFVAGGALLKDGSVRPTDLVVLATGFDSQEVLVGKLLGEEVAKKVGRIWGLGPDGEMNNMWKRTAQEGLWFVGGSFTNCRIYSRYVALQIKAIEEGMVPKAS
jgi:putative flavoprotein involved in K+ transport